MNFILQIIYCHTIHFTFLTAKIYTFVKVTFYCHQNNFIFTSMKMEFFVRKSAKDYIGA